MIPTLEDVARIMGLQVQGNPVTNTTLNDYRELSQRMLGYEDRSSGPLRIIKGSALTNILRVKGLMKRKEEGMDAYMQRMREKLAGRQAQVERK